MLVGYEGRNQYCLWNPIKKDVVVSRDVVFDEEKSPKSIVQITEDLIRHTTKALSAHKYTRCNVRDRI